MRSTFSAEALREKKERRVKVSRRTRDNTEKEGEGLPDLQRAGLRSVHQAKQIRKREKMKA